MEPGLAPLEALERALLPALRRPPCLVSFSGGRDSSGALAVAVRTARREGLPLPVPATLCFPEAEGTDESRWQELVVGSLELADWHRRTVGSDLDLLGPVARNALSRQGPLFPANAHAFAPLLEDAAGGSLVTGLDGDGLLGGWRWARLASVLRARVRAEPRDLLRVGLALAPRGLRRRVMRARAPWQLPWVSPAGQAAVTDAWTRQGESEPLRWDRRVAWYARLRYLAAARSVWEGMASGFDARIVHLFLDPAFLASLARAGGAGGFPDRTEAMRFLFDGLLPEVIIARPTKAIFTHALWGPSTRAFATSWEGAGIDARLVEPEALRGEWLAPEPDFRSALALHAAWLGTRADQREEAVGGGLD